MDCHQIHRHKDKPIGESMIGLLAMAAVSASAISEQARTCGITPDELAWSTDASGLPHADIRPRDKLDDLPFRSVGCLVTWAQNTGASVSFVAEPAPQTRPTTPSASLTQQQLDAISDRCRTPRKWLHDRAGMTHFKPNPKAPYGKIDCILHRLVPAGARRNGFVGNETIEPR